MFAQIMRLTQMDRLGRFAPLVNMALSRPWRPLWAVFGPVSVSLFTSGPEIASQGQKRGSAWPSPVPLQMFACITNRLLLLVVLYLAATSGSSAFSAAASSVVRWTSFQLTR